ncbi:hypothetical protein [Streptomyces poriticola]|uniref:hypothetical protein n=1 Tax=Streptomyces poriticola TaxID=3120506 RepID=UPI002FCE177E
MPGIVLAPGVRRPAGPSFQDTEHSPKRWNTVRSEAHKHLAVAGSLYRDAASAASAE